MILYNFYSNLTSAPIVNYFGKYFPGTKLLSYNIVSSEVNRFVAGSLGIDEDTEMGSKVFTFGWSNGSFSLIIQRDDKLFTSAPFPVESEDIKSHLIQVARDYKINEVIK